MRLVQWCATIAIAAGLAGPARSGEEAKVPFASMAEDFRSRLGLGEAKDGKEALDLALHSGAYVGLDLGTFEIWYPQEALGDKDRAEELKSLFASLVKLYDVWLDYCGQNAPATAEARKDLAAIGKWIDTWSASALRRVDPEGSPSLYDLLGAKDEIKSAARRLRTYEEQGIKKTAWDGGWNEPTIRVTRVVLCPTRKDFLELAAYAGSVDKDQHAVLWSEQMLERNSAWSDRTQLIALEAPGAFPPRPDQPFLASSMNHNDQTGLRQHVVERVATSLLRDIYYYLGVHFFEDALATNMVIAVCGRNMIGFNWSYEWKQQGATTQAYERFVPGGNPAGGSLPQRKARPGPLQVTAAYVSPWNATKGEKFFLDALKDSQKAGGQLAARDKDNPLRKDKTAHFEIKSEEGGKAAVVSAPFFGPAAEGKTLPPDKFLDDYEEFFRAYRSAFFEWIRMHGGSDEADSRRKFSLLIEGQATRKVDDTLSAIVESVYGVPLSAEDGSQDSLEWRFLAWLPKGK